MFILFASRTRRLVKAVESEQEVFANTICRVNVFLHVFFSVNSDGPHNWAACRVLGEMASCFPNRFCC